MFVALCVFTTLTTLSDLKHGLSDQFQDGAPLSVTCTVVSVSSITKTGSPFACYSVMSKGEYASVASTNNVHPVQAGDIVVATGHTGYERNGWQRAYVNKFLPVGHTQLPPPEAITAKELSSPRFKEHRVTMTGIVTDTFLDEIDPRFSLISLRSEHGPFLAVLGTDRLKQQPEIKVGAMIHLLGIASFLPRGGKRHYPNPYLSIGTGGHVRVCASSADPFNVPGIEDLDYMSAEAIGNLDRRCATGRVLAMQDKFTILLRTCQNRFVRVKLTTPVHLSPGCWIDVAGFPETDLFTLGLSKAVFRKTQPCASPTTEHPIDVSASDILSGPYGQNHLQPEYNGKLVRIRGLVPYPPQNSDVRRSFVLLSDNQQVPVDLAPSLDAADDLGPGYSVEVTGICILNTSDRTTERIHPHLDGIRLVPRTTGDIRIIERPPWLTPSKLMGLIIALLPLLAVLFIWNWTLRKLITRRSRMLFKAEIAQAKADLRVEDRTRLAADIHDSIAQTLTGVGFQIDAAAKTLSNDDRTACANFLDIAKRTLLSCREELRRCLWDLRAHAIENPDLTAAINETIRPVIGAAQVSVRFNVPRAYLSDSTAHALLCITRELVSNAMRHGKAGRIRVAGEYRNEHVRFSVSDDGAGFDPASQPGPSQGHFGLQGIRERLTKLNGAMTVASSRGNGTRIVVEIGKTVEIGR